MGEFMKSQKFARFCNRFFTYAFLLLLSLIIIYPLLITVSTAFREANIVSFQLDLHSNWTLDNFRELFTNTLYKNWYINTLIIAVATMVLQVVIKPLYAEQIYEKELRENESLHLEKIIAVTTSRDYEKELLLSRAYELLDQALESGYEELFQEHAAAWQKRWDKADVRIVGDPEAQQGIRFNLFRLFSTYYGDDPRLNIGPKGFTGEKYGGATYWDTEAYAVPMYLSVASPEVTRNLLLYRYNHLPQAYENAKKLGLKGALYPMVTFTGIECHNEWEITFEEIHRNGAIAYAIYNYVNYTGDKEYINQYGIDVLVGISRFFCRPSSFLGTKAKIHDSWCNWTE